MHDAQGREHVTPMRSVYDIIDCAPYLWQANQDAELGPFRRGRLSDDEARARITVVTWYGSVPATT